MPPVAQLRYWWRKVEATLRRTKKSQQLNKLLRAQAGGGWRFCGAIAVYQRAASVEPKNPRIFLALAT